MKNTIKHRDFRRECVWEGEHARERKPASGRASVREREREDAQKSRLIARAIAIESITNRSQQKPTAVAAAAGAIWLSVFVVNLSGTHVFHFSSAPGNNKPQCSPSRPTRGPTHTHFHSPHQQQQQQHLAIMVRLLLLHSVQNVPCARQMVMDTYIAVHAHTHTYKCVYICKWRRTCHVHLYALPIRNLCRVASGHSFLFYFLFVVGFFFVWLMPSVSLVYSLFFYIFLVSCCLV